MKQLEEAGDAQRFLAWAAQRMSWSYTGEIRLGVEMAQNEENERIALQDERARCWKRPGRKRRKLRQ